MKRILSSALAATCVTAALHGEPKSPPADLVTVRVIIRKANDRANAARFGNIAEDYGSYVLLRVSEKVIGRARAFGLDAEVLDERIGLGGFRFDPNRGGVPTVPAKLSDHERGAEPRYYLVQFRGPIRDAWIADVRQSGVELVQYVPENAMIVRATPPQMAIAGRGPNVRWSGLFHPAYKLSDDLGWLLGKPVPRTQQERQFYRVGVFHNHDLGQVIAAIKALGGDIDQQHEFDGLYFRTMRVALDTERVADLAALREICRIETWSPPEREDERSNQIVAGNYNSATSVATGYAAWLTSKGLSGSGITVGVVDDGVDVAETHLTGRVTDTAAIRHGAPSGAYGHGHHDAGIIAGSCTHADANGFLYGSGMAPSAHVLNIPFLNYNYVESEYTAHADVVATAAANGQVGTIASNSWGSASTGASYGAAEAAFDALVHDASSTLAGQQPLAIIFSAGNSGPSASTITSPKAAKNLLVVGASENYRPTQSSGITCGFITADNIDEVACFSSRGPASDGRFRPDVVAPGTWIASARAGSDTLWGNIDTYHRYSTGTSQAAPHVAGATALIQQWWKSTHSGQLPAPALSKAMIINGAVDPAAGTAIPNNIEGWGRMNLTNTIASGVPTIYNNQENVLTNAGQTYSLSGNVIDATKPFRVTLVWSDAPGAAGAHPAIVNNLDLEVAVGGNTYKGNVFSSGVSAIGGTADARNNVEAVYFPAGAVSGGFTVTVRATTVSGDGARGTGDTTDQHFALVVYNGSSCTPPSVPVASVATNGNNRIDVTWPAVAGATSYKVFRATTNGGPYTQVATPAASPYVDTTVAGHQTYYYVVRAVGSACESIDSTPVSATATGPLTPPSGLTSHFTSGNDVRLHWNAAPGALSYRIYRMSNNGALTAIGTSSTPAYIDPTPVANAAYLYTVRSVNGAVESLDSNRTLVTTVLFTDRLLAAGMPIRIVHLSEVRTAIQLVHNLAGVDSVLPFTDPVLSPAIPIKRAHIIELRGFLDAARLALGLPALAYTDPTITAAVTKMIPAHIIDLRLGAGTFYIPPPVTSQIFLNPGFELGAVNWTITPGAIDNTVPNQRSGSWKAWLCGTGSTNVDIIDQRVTIPADALAATLSFWLRIDTHESSQFTPYDSLKVYLLGDDGAIIATLASYSNLDVTYGQYVQKTFDLLPYAGQSFRIRFNGHEDSSLATDFLIDDTSLNVTYPVQ